MKLLSLVLSFFICTNLIAQTATDFSLVDTDGVEHNLYEDYLNQGKTVMLHVGAQWNHWDSVFLSLGVMQEFHDTYVPSGNAVLLFVEPFGPDLETLNGSNGGFNLLDAVNYPLVLGNQQFMEDYLISYFPTIRLICPDGSLHSDQSDSLLFYGHFESAEIIADKMFDFCGTEFDLASVTSEIFHDQNADCVQDADEQNLPKIKMLIDGPGDEYVRYSNDEGILRFLAVNGNYTMTLCPPNDLWTTCNGTQSVTITNEDQRELLSFGLEALDDCPLLEADITSPFLRRCFDSYLFVDYCNNGTAELHNSFFEIELDEHLIFKSSEPAPSSVIGSTLIYELGTIPLWFCDKIKITVEVSCMAELGEEQCYSLTYGPTYPCDTRSNNKVTECQEVIGAFDPNDKRAFPLGEGDNYIVKPNETIKYQIRFQNTGTDTAFNIVVEDIISEQLDLATLVPGQSSHDYTVQVDDGRKVTFKFDNIMLPDSNVNLQGSNGFINYQIDQLPNHPNDLRIENDAAIFFDFNEPIWTNKTIHTVNDGISNTDDFQIAACSLAPNPAGNWMTITLNDRGWENAEAQVLSVSGQLIWQQKLAMSTTLNTSELTEGIYLLKLRSEEGLLSQQMFSVAR